MNFCSVNPYQPLDVRLKAQQPHPPLLLDAPAPAAEPLPGPVKAEDSKDNFKLYSWFKTGVDGTNAVGSVITLPNEALKLADGMADAAKALSRYDDLLVPLKSRPLAALGSRALSGTLRVLEESATVTKAARAIMQVPVVGRLTQPHVADFVSQKVMPTANALASGISIYDHSRRFQKASAEGNTAAQVLSGVQIGLNAVSAVTGYMKGGAQTVSAVAGLSSLALDVGSWATGIGHIKLD